MKTLGSFITLLAALLLTSSDADATGCLAAARGRVVQQRRAVVVQHRVVAPVVHRQALAAVFVPVAALLQPQGYSATYGGPDASAELLRQLQQLRAEVQALKKGQAQPFGAEQIQPPRGAAAPVGTAFASCTACHSEGKPKGGLVLVTKDGAEVLLTAEQKLEVLRRIDLDPADPQHMPPKAELTDEQLNKITQSVLRKK